MKLIDVHAHLTDGRYDGGADGVIRDFKDFGGEYIIDAGYGLSSSEGALKNAEKYAEVYCTVGVHPENAREYSDEAEGFLSAAAKSSKCVGIGEIGLDYHYDGYDKSLQKEIFARQIALANALGLPFVVHSRDASRDVLELLKAHKNEINHGFLMHCYSESAEQARAYIELGAYFSFGGVVTFKNAKKEEIIKTVPLDRVLAETDSPYLTPEPFRGRLNQPKNVKFVYEKLADVYGVGAESFAEQVENNAFSLFRRLGK